MQATKTLYAAHKPMIHFLGPRAALWKGKQLFEIRNNGGNKLLMS